MSGNRFLTTPRGLATAFPGTAQLREINRHQPAADRPVRERSGLRGRLIDRGKHAPYPLPPPLQIGRSISHEHVDPGQIGQRRPGEPHLAAAGAEVEQQMGSLLRSD